MMSNQVDYYITRKPKLLKEFDRDARTIWPVLSRYFGEQNVASLVRETRQEYATLIPALPYIGGKQPFTQFIISTGLLLAVYRRAKANGKTIEETGRLIFEISQAYLQAYPVFLRRFFAGMNFSSFYLKRLQKRAEESHQRRYADDYVYNYVAGDGVTFDYGVDYLECASCKFLARQNALELAPYLCAADVLYSEALGWGLSRTMTLAEGAEKCDFRFRKGGQTQVAVPEALQALVATRMV